VVETKSCQAYVGYGAGIKENCSISLKKTLKIEVLFTKEEDINNFFPYPYRISLKFQSSKNKSEKISSYEGLVKSFEDNFNNYGLFMREQDKFDLKKFLKVAEKNDNLVFFVHLILESTITPDSKQSLNSLIENFCEKIKKDFFISIDNIIINSKSQNELFYNFKSLPWEQIIKYNNDKLEDFSIEIEKIHSKEEESEVFDCIFQILFSKYDFPTLFKIKKNGKPLVDEHLYKFIITDQILQLTRGEADEDLLSGVASLLEE
jgi:hypothetical protein